MPRLVRIAITLLISATVLVFLIRQRAEQLRIDMKRGLTEEAIANETQMITLGTIVAGALILGGIVLLVVQVVRGRKRKRIDG